MSKRQRGTGTVFQHGKTWWIQYYAKGLRQRENSGFQDKKDADNLLKQRIGEVAAGRHVAPGKATIADLCKLVIDDYRLRGLRDLKIVEWRYRAHIQKPLGSLLAARFGSSQIKEYIQLRRTAEASDTTINRELAIVRRGFKLGFLEDPPLVYRQPRIPGLEEDNARQGFLDLEQYELLLSHLPMRLKALFVCAYHVGARKGELRKIQWDQVDFDGGVIRLQAKQTKGKAARMLPIYGDMEGWLQFQYDHRPDGCLWVFNHNSKPVGAQLEGWRQACERAGVPDLLFHDLRRSAIRNMKRAGIQDGVAMKISGHKTRSVFDRYNIVDEADFSDAGDLLNEYVKKRKAARAAKLKRVK